MSLLRVNQLSPTDDSVVIEVADLLDKSGLITNGDKLIGIKNNYAGAVSRTQESKNDESLSALDFGAKGDGSTDDTSALQAAITAAIAQGRSLYIPFGKYRTTSRLVVDGSCIIYGDGWQDVRDYTGATTRDWTKQFTRGTIIYQDYLASADAYGFYVTGNSVSISDLEIEHNQGNPGSGSWTPSVTPTAIYAYAQPYYEHGGQSVMVENVMLRNVYRGIYLINVARGVIDRIFGQVINTGISVDRSGDVVRISNIHLGWTFWSSASAVMNYQIANTTAIQLGRVDNPQLYNIFTFGIKVGIQCYTETTGHMTGGVSRLHGTNFGFDDCVYGLLLQDACEVSVSNLYAYCRANSGTNSVAVYSFNTLGSGYNTTLQLTNVDLMGCDANAIYLANGGTATLSNVRIRSWNSLNSGYAAIRTDSGHITINGLDTNNSSSNSADVFQTTSTGTISGQVNPSNDALFSLVTFYGTCDSSGSAVITHGISGAVTKGLMAQCFYRAATDGAMTPMTTQYVNGTQIAFSGGVANLAYRATFMYSPKILSW
ncbi:glycosyl hydrolase family 28-related protein [Pantoea piersonii]|uniref:Rhamnogalacturonase A/B/Epimerase-like pectate lyase domain-containing protein n=1 Tax=Pantoea piersonii TaxID=2364647 RepID=A0AAJ5QHD4_9GAMM|nr:glycosyl hydrolase family 28-related protein [Pantoea piersonii]WBG90011.1 hypothetical protein N5580_13030 [Pantoea piersonii]